MSWFRRRRPDDGYPVGSCTRYLYDAVPWVPLGWGDAYQWADSAQHAGLVVQDTPDARALVVIPPGPLYGPLGHVANVVEVLPGQMIRIMDYPAWTVADVPLTMWPLVGGLRYIMPPADTTRRLARGALHNGGGDAVDFISQVMQAYDDFCNYWNLRVGLQHDVLQIVNDQLGQYD